MWIGWQGPVGLLQYCGTIVALWHCGTDSLGSLHYGKALSGFSHCCTIAQTCWADRTMVLLHCGKGLLGFWTYGIMVLVLLRYNGTGRKKYGTDLLGFSHCGKHHCKDLLGSLHYGTMARACWAGLTPWQTGCQPPTSCANIQPENCAERFAKIHRTG